jgi:hypothetical protein
MLFSRHTIGLPSGQILISFSLSGIANSLLSYNMKVEGGKCPGKFFFQSILKRFAMVSQKR